MLLAQYFKGHFCGLDLSYFFCTAANFTFLLCGLKPVRYMQCEVSGKKHKCNFSE